MIMIACAIFSSLSHPLDVQDKEEDPLIKRRKLDHAEMEKILNAKSSHEWAARDVGHMTDCTYCYKSCDRCMIVM